MRTYVHTRTSMLIALFVTFNSQKVETTDVYQLINEQVKCGIGEY